MFKAQTIVIQFTCNETFEKLPNLYIKSLSDAICANAYNFNVLETVRQDLISLRSLVDHYQDQIWAREHGYDIPIRTNWAEPEIKLEEVV